MQTRGVLTDATKKRHLELTTRTHTKNQGCSAIFVIAGIVAASATALIISTSPAEPPAKPVEEVPIALTVGNPSEWKKIMKEPATTKPAPAEAPPVARSVLGGASIAPSEECAKYATVTEEELRADRKKFALYGIDLKIAVEFKPGEVSAMAIPFLREEAEPLLQKRLCGQLARKNDPEFARAADRTKATIKSLQKFKVQFKEK
jgi:hypothetical protein